MKLRRLGRSEFLPWIIPGAIAVLCLTLGILQYRFMGEVSRAERERLQGSLQTSLNRLREDFNAELSFALSALYQPFPAASLAERARQYADGHSQWRENSQHGRLIRSIAIAEPEGDELKLYRLDPGGRALTEVAWPEDWSVLHERLLQKVNSSTAPDRRWPGPVTETFADVIELPVFSRNNFSFEGPPRELEWIVVQLDLNYVRSVMAPALLQRFLGGSGNVEYQAEIVQASEPSVVIYRSGGLSAPSVAERADASVRLFEERFGRGGGPGGRRGGPPDGRPPRRLQERPPPGGPGPPESGRWLLSVRHRAGSLEAVVAQGRRRNVAITSGILLLIVASALSLLRSTRRAQRLAELQMQFVASVSHELRTPLAVMRTAGHNLRGRIAQDSRRVQQYGSLIEDESNKLTAIVESVLRFSNVNAGRAIGTREELCVSSTISEALDSARAKIEAAGCTLETAIDDDLPGVSGDRTALRQALENLFDNAAKYSKAGDRIRIAAGATDRGVRITVSDEGRGIPSDEVGHIFDPFFRGRQVVADQIHGTGLGLHLVKRIIEAHGGSIAVRSEEGRGTEFTMILPALTTGKGHELTNITG